MVKCVELPWTEWCSGECEWGERGGRVGVGREGVRREGGGGGTQESSPASPVVHVRHGEADDGTGE